MNAEETAMQERHYQVMLTGETSLLLHRDNLEWAETMKRWGKDPANKRESIAGDDRSPAWRWIGNIYADRGLCVIPADNLMTMLREGGAKCPTGKGQATFKRQTQSGIIVDQVAWPISIGGATISYQPIMALVNDPDFEKHLKVVEDLGFTLLVKRAKIGPAKHVRVRPRFTRWECQGTVTVLDEMISTEVLQNILTFAGTYCGLGDWRPSSPKSPGPWGKFSATVKEV
jgi:hypothetical protein